MDDLTKRELIFLHVSDIHLDEDDSKNKSVKDNFARLAAYIHANEEGDSPKRHVVLLTGDIGNSAKGQEIKNFMDILERNDIGDRIMMVPGNHDACSLGNEIGKLSFNEDAVNRYQATQFELLAKCRRFIMTCVDPDAKIHIASPKCDYFIKNKFFCWTNRSKVRCTPRIVEYSNRKIVIVLLDSNPQNVMFSINFAQGEIGAKQMSVLKDVATNKKYEGWTKIVLLHHHPVYNNFFLKLKDADEFLKIIWDTFKIVCFGHKHCTNEWTSHAGYISAAPALRDLNFAYSYTFDVDGNVTFGRVQF